MRFYPDYFPSFEDEPNKNDFEVKRHESIDGLALFSKKDFQKGDIVFRFTGVLSPTMTQHSLMFRNLHIDDIYVMGFVAHACNPNCFVDMDNLTFYAVRDISAGELITMNYYQTETRLFASFRCNCGYKDCIGELPLIKPNGYTLPLDLSSFKHEKTTEIK